MSGLHALLLDAARAEGFPLAGALDLERAREAFAPHVERYDEWLARGSHGAMAYLRRGRDRRADPRQVFPEAKSILCVAQPYPAAPAGQLDSRQGPRYARYLRRADYHDELAERLERVMQAASKAWVETDLRSVTRMNEEPLRWKICVDTSAVLERSWAALAGLGWIGKNTLLIHPRYGSYLFLGEVLISQETGQGPTPLPDYCGRCERCLKSCPTGALREPHWLDATRCVSYWSLEKRGELALAEPELQAAGTWIAGCDLCQEACPFNTRPSRAADPSNGTGERPGAVALDSWRALLLEDEAAYKARVRGSSLSRVKPAQFRRNLAHALANAIEADRRSGEECATWTSELAPLVARRHHEEPDPAAREAWERCWSLLRKRN